MSKEELIVKLYEYSEWDPESGHIEADKALLAYIADDEIAEAYKAIAKWYA